MQFVKPANRPRKLIDFLPVWHQPTVRMPRVTSGITEVTNNDTTPLHAQWEVTARTLPSYAERYQELRQQVTDGLLTESEREHIEGHQQVYQCAFSGFEAYCKGLVTVDEMVRIAREGRKA